LRPLRKNDQCGLIIPQINAQLRYKPNIATALMHWTSRKTRKKQSFDDPEKAKLIFCSNITWHVGFEKLGQN